MTSNQLSLVSYVALAFSVGFGSAVLTVLLAKLCKSDETESRLDGLEMDIENLEAKLDKAIEVAADTIKCIGVMAEILTIDEKKIIDLQSESAELWAECADLWSELDYDPSADLSAADEAVDCPSDCPCRDDDDGSGTGSVNRTVDFAEMPGDFISGYNGNRS